MPKTENAEVSCRELREAAHLMGHMVAELLCDKMDSGTATVKERAAWKTSVALRRLASGPTREEKELERTQKLIMDHTIVPNLACDDDIDRWSAAREALDKYGLALLAEAQRK